MQTHQRPKVADSIVFVPKWRKSAPFNYSFRSDCKVRELVNGFQRELIEDTLGKNKHSSGFEIKRCLLSFIDTPPVASSSNKASCQTSVGLASTPAETGNDPSIYFHFDNTEDIDTSVVKKKRTYSSTGPLSISPSQKRSKCQPANASENPCSTGVPSSIVAADPKVRFSEVLITNGNTLPTPSTGKSNVPSSDISPANDASKSSVVSTNVPAAAVTNLTTLVGYTPALGDGDIIRAVRDHNNNELNWAQLDKKLKKPEGYSRDRYFNVLRKYAMYDVTITRAVLSAQVKNQPVQWALLDQQYTLGRAEARWNRVLRPHCDMKGITVNGILRPELHNQYRNTTEPPRSTTGGTINANLCTSANTVLNTNLSSTSSALATRPVVTHAVTLGPSLTQVIPTSSSFITTHSPAGGLNDTRPFTAAEDKQLMSSIDYVLQKKMPIELSWTTIAQYMNRSLDSLKARWSLLKATENRTQRQEQVQGHGNGVLDLTQSGNINIAPISSGYFGHPFSIPVYAPTQSTSYMYNTQTAPITAPVAHSANGAPIQHYGSNALFPGTTPNNNPYTPAEDKLILARIPTSIQAPGANLPMFVYNQFLRLSYELNRPLASVRERWQALFERSMTACTSTPVANSREAESAYYASSNSFGKIGSSGSNAANSTTITPKPYPQVGDVSAEVNSVSGLLAQPSLLNKPNNKILLTPSMQVLPSIPLASKSVPLPVPFSATSVPFATSSTHVQPATPALIDKTNTGSIASKHTTAIATPTPAMPVSLANSANSMRGLLSQPCLLNKTTSQSVFSNSQQNEKSAVKPLPSIPLASKSQPLPIPFSAVPVAIAVPAKRATAAISVIASSGAASEEHGTTSNSSGITASGVTVVDITIGHSANNLSGELLSQPCLLNTSINASVFALSKQAEGISTPLPSIPVASKSLPLPTTFPTMPVTLAASTATVDTIDLGLHAAGVESEEPVAVENTGTNCSCPDSQKFNTGLFTSAEDQSILTAVPLSDHLDFYGEEWNARFAQLCQELNRSATNITQRWLQLVKAGKTTHGRPKINTSTPRNKDFTGTKTMHNKSTAGEISTGADVSLASHSSVVASQTTHDCADLNPQRNNDPVVCSYALLVNATNNTSADVPTSPDNNSCKSPFRRVDVLTVGGQKVIVRKTADTRTVSSLVSVNTFAASATDRAHSAPETSTNITTISTGQSAEKARYGILNLVKKSEQMQSTPTTGQERSPTTVRFDNTVDENEYTAAEDARIMEVVTSVLKNGSKYNNAWEDLAAELNKDVLSLKSRWLQIFKTKRKLDRSSFNRASSSGLARLLTVQAALPLTSVEENCVAETPSISTQTTPVSPAFPDSAEINTPSKPTSAVKDCSMTADVTSPTLSLNSARSHEMSSSTGLKLAMSPLQLDREVNPTRVVVFPSKENLHDAYVDSESGDYW